MQLPLHFTRDLSQTFTDVSSSRALAHIVGFSLLEHFWRKWPFIVFSVCFIIGNLQTFLLEAACLFRIFHGGYQPASPPPLFSTPTIFNSFLPFHWLNPDPPPSPLHPTPFGLTMTPSPRVTFYYVPSKKWGYIALLR